MMAQHCSSEGKQQRTQTTREIKSFWKTHQQSGLDKSGFCSLFFCFFLVDLASEAFKWWLLPITRHRLVYSNIDWCKKCISLTRGQRAATGKFGHQLLFIHPANADRQSSALGKWQHHQITQSDQCTRKQAIEALGLHAVNTPLCSPSSLYKFKQFKSYSLKYIGEKEINGSFVILRKQFQGVWYIVSSGLQFAFLCNCVANPLAVEKNQMEKLCGLSIKEWN